MITRKRRRSISSKPATSISRRSLAIATVFVSIAPEPRTWAKSRTRRKRRFAMRGGRRASRAAGDFEGRVFVARDLEELRAPLDDLRELVDRVKIEAHHVAEAREERRGQTARARRRADEREGVHVDLDRRGEGPLARH